MVITKLVEEEAHKLNQMVELLKLSLRDNNSNKNHNKNNNSNRNKRRKILKEESD